MGLLDQLWDDTVAGPAPETGLGKLRKHSTFSFRSNSGNKEVESVARSNSEDLSDEVHRNVTRSIMILKPRPGNLTINGNDGGGSSAPASPAGSTPPVSPFTPSGSPFSGGRESNRFRRRLSSDVYERGAASSAPTGVPIRAAAATATAAAMGDGSRGTPPTYNM
ncbi:hypothetical protein MKW98_027415 [Papaver atlanticum]|uniref:Uncharacterized protein n=1 Tax=Papaver atlanticum TaxID=357466 RepID=A0AAD4XUE0_9MAGN|nr:hypothetical protein MKW98_027415 [Papaver atlanticum]